MSELLMERGSLRMCRICGLVAYTETDLEHFAKDSKSKHGRARICLPCERRRGREKYPRWLAKNEGRSYIRERRGVERWYVIQNGRERPRSNVIMEEILGRPLIPNEVTHHINGDTLDDSLGNLKLMIKREHDKLHENLRGFLGLSGSEHPSWKGDKALPETIRRRMYHHRYRFRKKLECETT